MLEGINMASLVYLKHKNGTTYVYENVSYWDKKSKKPKSKRKCIGHLDPDTGSVQPNGMRGGNQKNIMPKSEKEPPKCFTYSCGVSSLLDKVCADIGLGHILKKSFPNDWDAILTCAYYLVSEGQALSRAEKWSQQAVTPYGAVLADQRISELLIRITPELVQGFFSAWMEHNSCDRYYCMDITSVSSYSELNEFVSYGYNRDKEKLPQVNLLMVSGHTSRLPLFFRAMPGSIHDVSTMDESLKRLDLVDAKRLHMVMDKGFYSEDNVDAMYRRHMRFLVGVPFTTSLSLDAVERHRNDEMISYRHYCNVLGEELYADTELIKWKGHRCYLHVYFDSIRAALDEKKFSHRILMEYEELCSGSTVKEHQKDYERFFTVKETPKRGRKVEYNQEVIDACRKNSVGWLVLATNDVKDPVEALELYRMKDTIEKHFDDLKNDLDMKRLRIHSSAAMDGRMFIQYIALIFSSQIKNIMDKAGWFKSHNMQEVIDEMKSLRMVSVEGKRKQIYTTATAFQKEIIELFGINIG
jgi:transposase